MGIKEENIGIRSDLQNKSGITPSDMAHQETASLQTGASVLRRHIKENPRKAALAQHRLWMASIPHEYPMPYTPYKIGVYIRYFNQTRYEDYLSAHKKQFLDTLALCPNWDFIGFYVDEGGTAPNMESAPEWSRLLQDCYDGKVDLVITQKASNISKKLSELAFCARLLASLQRPVGIYFVSEDMYTLASYYCEDLHDPFFLPSPDWKILSDDEPRREMLND